MVNGWRWDKILATWMQVRQDLNGSKTHIMRPGWVSDWTWMDTRCSFWDPHEGETWPGWRWDANIETWIEVSCNIDGCEILISHQVSIISSHFHPGDISPLKLHRSSTLFPSQCHPGLIPQGPEIIISPPSRSRLTCILVPIFAPHFHQGGYHLHPALIMHGTSPSNSHRNSSQV